jgi:uncharacterized membrane protein YgcG
MSLEKNGVLHVTERIETVFSEMKHGIYRDIPMFYENGRGFTRSVMLSNISVTDGQGAPLGTLVTREGDGVHIRIGDKDEYVPVGPPVVYVIHYDAFGQMNWFDSAAEWEPYAELYWNVTGNNWQADMDRVSFSVTFPDIGEAKDARARLFAGPYGTKQFLDVPGGVPQVSSGPLSLVGSLDRKTFVGEVSRPLYAGEGVTLVLAVPANTINKPTILQQIWLIVMPNVGLVIPVIVFLAMAFFWFRFGRDPAKKPISVQFEPPGGISGPEAGTLLDERVDARDLSAGFISLAVKGHIILHPEVSAGLFGSRTATITFTDKEGAVLTPFEAMLLRRLKVPTPPVTNSDLRTYVAPHLSSLKESLYDTMVDRGYYLANPNKVRVGWFVGTLVACALMGFATTAISPTHEPLPSIIGAIAGAVVGGMFSLIMPRRTYEGAEAHRQVAGFREFIMRARGKEIDWMSKKDPTASLFEEYLPHAVAFGLAVEWAEAFEGILHEMPSWYDSPYSGRFMPIYFGQDLVSVTNSMTSAATTPPRSSGGSGGSSGFSSGGGFSGGGFGGGGGGSW